MLFRPLGTGNFDEGGVGGGAAATHLPKAGSQVTKEGLASTTPGTFIGVAVSERKSCMI